MQFEHEPPVVRALVLTAFDEAAGIDEVEVSPDTLVGLSDGGLLSRGERVVVTLSETEDDVTTVEVSAERVAARNLMSRPERYRNRVLKELRRLRSEGLDRILDPVDVTTVSEDEGARTVLRLDCPRNEAALLVESAFEDTSEIVTTASDGDHVFGRGDEAIPGAVEHVAVELSATDGPGTATRLAVRSERPDAPDSMEFADSTRTTFLGSLRAVCARGYDERLDGSTDEDRLDPSFDRPLPAVATLVRAALERTSGTVNYHGDGETFAGRAALHPLSFGERVTVTLTDEPSGPVTAAVSAEKLSPGDVDAAPEEYRRAFERELRSIREWSVDEAFAATSLPAEFDPCEAAHAFGFDHDDEATRTLVGEAFERTDGIDRWSVRGTELVGEQVEDDDTAVERVVVRLPESQPADSRTWAHVRDVDGDPAAVRDRFLDELKHLHGSGGDEVLRRNGRGRRR